MIVVVDIVLLAVVVGAVIWALYIREPKDPRGPSE